MKKLLLIFLILSMVFTSACWDMIELEDRILPYSVAIDLNTEEQDNNDKKSLFVCFAYPNINALGKNPTQEELVYIINSNANSIFDATSELSSRVYNPIFLKHLNVLIISEEVASNEQLVREIMDGLQRDFIINKMIEILVTKGSAHEIFTKKMESTRQETLEGLLISLLRNEQESNKFTPINSMKFIQYMDHKRVAVVPLTIPEPEITLSGGGLFKDYKLIGYISEDDNRHIAVLNNDANSDDIDYEYNGVNLSISLKEVKSKKKLVKDSEVLKIQYNVEMDGQIHQYIIDEDKKIDSQEVLVDMEDEIESIVEENIMATIDKLQSEFNADALGILEYLYKFHPKVYKEVEADWDNIFPHIEIDVDVEVNIRRRGLSDY